MPRTGTYGAWAGERSDSLSARLLFATLLLLIIVPAVGLTLGAGIRAHRVAIDDARSEDPEAGMYVPVAFSSRAASTTQGLFLFNLVSAGIAAVLALAATWWSADHLLRRPDNDTTVRYRHLFENANERLRREMAERVRLEAELIQSAKMASLGIMAGGIAHEVRNPLAIVSAAAQLLLEQPDDDRLRAEGLQRIHTGVQRATSIVENLLKFACPMPGQMQAADINDLVRETLAMVEHEITQRRITLQTRLAEDVRPVRANPSALEQVFTNLILNACQAIERDGTITVSTAMQGSDVTISVSDTGPGIRPEDLHRIFDPFFTTRPPGEGTGLGLAISCRIVEQHRGTIDAFNNEQGGAMFVVRLPGVDGGRSAGGRSDRPVA